MDVWVGMGVQVNSQTDQGAVADQEKMEAVVKSAGRRRFALTRTYFEDHLDCYTCFESLLNITEHENLIH
jgi:hypothetical protein